MQQHRIISLASILIMLIIPVIGWFLVAQPQLAAAETADLQRAETETQIAASTALIAQLAEDSRKLPDLNDDLNKLRTTIPADVDSDGYIDGLDALAQVSHVLITGLTVADPTVYVPAAPTVDPAAATATEETPEASPDAPVAEPVAPVVDNPALVTSPLIDSSNFLAIAVSVEVRGPYLSILDFVDGIQSSPRLFLVTNMSISEDEQNPGTFIGTTSGFIYAIPTGVEGKPRPISTTVKQLTAPVPVVVEEDTDEDAGTADPDPTNTPAP